MPETMGQPLGQWERVLDTYIAPTKTFTDILRSTSWWLPALLLAMMTLAVTYTIDRKVGFERVAENQIQENPAQEEQLNQLPPEQRAARMHIVGAVTKYISYAVPALVLVIPLLGALVLWCSFNFGLGARTSFVQMYAVWMYAALPRMLSALLTILTLCFGDTAETFNIKQPVGTNLGYYLPDVAPWLRAALNALDFIGLWNLALLVIGTSIVARVKIGAAAAVIVGWWLLIVLIAMGWAAASS